MNTIKKFYKETIALIQFILSSAIGADYKTLNSYMIKINRANNIDSIIHQLSLCLFDILDYKFFAFAVYDSEYNGGVDIWSDSYINNIDIIKLVKKDFPSHNLYYNIHSFHNESENNTQELSININDVLSYKIIDVRTQSILYILPQKMVFSYHKAFLDTILEIIKVSISNFFNFKKLENDALIDPLTHCYNRRALNEYLDHDIANVERYGSELSAIMLDIDHFKKINDTYGHKSGDAVLQSVSKSLLSAVRRGDYLARYGGEEFIIVLPETKFSEAIELAERLRKIIENLKINVEAKNINITASLGVTLYKNGTDKNILLKRADDMLYKAKRMGRNRVEPDLKLCSNIPAKKYQTFKK
jgi:diguanylate cyclase (GGDEF)-like protein